jgi:VanZ family protein
MTILLVACLLIFHNSMYPLAQSDLQSGAVMGTLNYLLGKMNLHFTFTQFAVRKLAHFTEYFLFGIILSMTIWTFTKNKCIFFELFLFLAVPVADETIQIFYDGRTSSVRDVMIDFFGCLAGMALYRVVRRKTRSAKKA